MTHPTFCDWLAIKVGTQRWCVARRLTDRMRDRHGYELAIPQKRFTALKAEYEAEGTRQ